MKTNRISAWFISALFALAFVSSAQATSSLTKATIGVQSPAIAACGGLCYFPITVTRAGLGSLTVYLSVSGLPTGATYEFVPPEIAFSDQGPSTKNAVLVVRLLSSTPAGDYPIVLSARHGKSPIVLTSTTVLKVGANRVIGTPPWLNVPVPQPDGNMGISGGGTPSQPILVLATTNLTSASSWETISVQTLDERGLFSLVDQDATNYPARFYRLAQ